MVDKIQYRVFYANESPYARPIATVKAMTQDEAVAKIRKKLCGYGTVQITWTNRLGNAMIVTTNV